MSSASDKPYQAKWLKRQGFSRDPQIFLKRGLLLYFGGNDTSDNYKEVLKHDGADVYIATQDDEEVRLAKIESDRLIAEQAAAEIALEDAQEA